MTPIQSQPSTAKNTQRMASTGQNFITREPPLLLFNRENVKKKEQDSLEAQNLSSKAKESSLLVDGDGDKVESTCSLPDLLEEEDR